MKKNKNQKGFVALIALLIVAAAGLTIGIAASLSGVDELLVSFGGSQAKKAQGLAHTCIEDGLERLRLDFSNYSGGLSIDVNSCIIKIAVSGSVATLYATGTVDMYNQKIEVQVDNELEVINWQED